MNRATRALANLALLLASGLVSLLLCEVGLRLFYPKWQHLAEAAFVRDPTLIYSPIPNHCDSFPHPDTGEQHSVCYNNLGLRQHRNFSVADLESSVNIAFFGDSYTENMHVPAQHSFTEPLDYLLNLGRGEKGGEKRINVLNFGVAGYGTGQSLLRYEASSVRGALNHLFYIYFENDLLNDQAAGLFQLNEAGQLERNRASAGGWTSLLGRLHLSYLVLDSFGRLSQHLDEAKARAQQTSKEYFQRSRSMNAEGLPPSAYAVFRQLLRRWSQAAEAQGATFRLVWLPMAGYDAAAAAPRLPGVVTWRGGAGSADPPPGVAAIVREEGVEAVDLHRCFAERDPNHLRTPWRGSPYRFEHDAHWNEVGNRLAAVCLYRFLESELRLPKLSEADLQKALRRYYSAFEQSGSLAGPPAASLEAAVLREKYGEFYLYGPQWREVVRELASDPEQAIIRAAFDVYRHGRRLVYVKDGGCRPADFKERFLLHVVPVRKQDLPPNRLEHGFDNRDFFAVADEATCSVTAELPSYPIERIFTGQYIRGKDGDYQNLWKEEHVF